MRHFSGSNIAGVVPFLLIGLSCSAFLGTALPTVQNMTNGHWDQAKKTGGIAAFFCLLTCIAFCFFQMA